MLFLSPFPSRPLYGGAVVRNHYLAQALTARHRVWASYCGLDGGGQFEGELPLAGEGLRALFDPRFLWRAYRLVRTQQIEAIVSSSLISGLHGALLKLLTGRTFWMDEHNVEWHCSKRYGHRLWWLIYLLEGFIVRVADFVTCVSEEDRSRLLHSFKLSPERVSVAPNGVNYRDLQALSTASQARREGKRLLFFGVLDYPPNRQAVEFLGEQLQPRLPAEVELVVVGRGGEELKRRFPALRFEGFVEDIHSFILECDGLIVPIFSGGGTRMKILETVACGRPVCSTSCGAEGIRLEVLGNCITIADGLEDMLHWVEDLQPEISVEPSREFRELYDWSRIWQNGAPL